MSVVDQLKHQAWNRRMYDACKSTDDMRVSTGPGRYVLDSSPHYCNATFAPEPTVRQQRWGASMNSQYTKTDVESDLLNINRPSTKTACGQYNPTTSKVNRVAADTKMKEESFPQTHSRLVDPPCSLRGSGWNRFEWLCENPQEGTMIPFDNLVTTRLLAKDSHRPCIPQPRAASGLPPVAADGGVSYEALEAGTLHKLNSSLTRILSQMPGDKDALPVPTQ